MSKNKDESKTLKQILSTDYHIPGISPRFYLPAVLLAFAVVIAWIIWTPGYHNGDWAFAIAVFVTFAVSAVSTTVQRVIRSFRRK